MYNGTSARPLIINMHGYTSNALQQQYYSNFMPIADTANFLMVFPQGTKDGNGTTFWNAGVGASVDDVGFLSQLIDTLSSHYNINANRIYSTGFSMGGFMSHILALTLSNRIAAIASVSGTFFTNQFPNVPYVATKPVPVMQIHGTADATVPYPGSSANSMVSATTTVNFWVAANNCNSIPTASAVPNISTTDNCTADHFLYSGGVNGNTVEHFRVNGGAHSWPGATFTNGVTSHDFSASKEIWRFFNQYILNTSATAIKELDNLNVVDVDLYPNPTKDNVTICFKGENYKTVDMTIFNSLGQKVVTQSLSSIIKNTTICLVDLPPGIYHIQLLTNNHNIGYKTLVITN